MVTMLPWVSVPMVSVSCRLSAGPSSPSRTAGLTSCTAPDSSRRMTNCTFFWSRTVSTQPDTLTSHSCGREGRWAMRVREVTKVESTSLFAGGFMPAEPRLGVCLPTLFTWFDTVK